MPEKRLERTRESLPSGYQFGDARPSGWDRYVAPAFDAMQAERDERIAQYLKPMMDRIADRAVGWNVIEGETWK